MKKKVAIYIRVSTSRQATEGYSLEAQEKILLEYCEKNEYKALPIYADRGISAKEMKHRPEFLRLIEDAKQNKFDMVLIWKLTRFARSMVNLITVCDMLDKLGIPLVSYSEAFDSTTPLGRLCRSILGAVAEFGREEIAENVLLGLTERASQGKRTATIVLGYDLVEDSLKIIDSEAETVRQLFAWYAETGSMNQVSILCQKHGIKGKKGGSMLVPCITTILSNPIYCGYNRFLEQTIRGTHEPLISVEEFNKIQHMLNKNGKSKRKVVKYPLIDAGILA